MEISEIDKVVESEVDIDKVEAIEVEFDKVVVICAEIVKVVVIEEEIDKEVKMSHDKLGDGENEVLMYDGEWGDSDEVKSNHIELCDGDCEEDMNYYEFDDDKKVRLNYEVLDDSNITERLNYDELGDRDVKLITNYGRDPVYLEIINDDEMSDMKHDLKFDDYIWSAKIRECYRVGGKIDEIEEIDKVEEIEEEIDKMEEIEEQFDMLEDNEEGIDKFMVIMQDMDKVVETDNAEVIDVEFGKVGLIIDIVDVAGGCINKVTNWHLGKVIDIGNASGLVDVCDVISDELLGIMDTTEWIFGNVDGEVMGANKGMFEKLVSNQVSKPREGFWRGDVRSDMLR